MEKIDADVHRQCYECQYFGVDTVEFDKGINGYVSVCKSCLLKAYLLVNPIQFDKELLSQWIQHVSGTDFRSEYNNNLRKFIDWLLPFLESK